MRFEAFSRLRINLSKSKIIPVGTVSNVETLAIELGCGVGSLPTTYLGLPLGGPHKSEGFGTLLKRDSEIGWPLGRDNTSLRAEDSR